MQDDYDSLKGSGSELEKLNQLNYELRIKNEFYERELSYFKKQEFLFESLVNKSPLSTFLINSNTGEILYCNKSFIDLTGYYPEDISTLDKFFNTVFPNKRYQTQVKSSWLKNIVNNDSINEESHFFDFRCKNGTIKSIKFTSVHIDCNLVVVYLEAVTEKSILEKKLLDAEEQFNLLINSTPDLMCIKDGQGRWQLANDTIIRLFSLESIPFIGKTCSELAELNPQLKEELDFCSLTDELAWLNGILTRCDETIASSDNTVQVFDVIKVPVFNNDGSRKGLIVFGRDITERKIVEKELEAREKEQKAIFNTIPDLIFKITEDGIILNYEGKENNLFTSLDYFLGKNISEILPATVTNKAYSLIRKTLDSGTIQTFVFKLPDKESVHHYEARIAPFDKNSVIAIIRNITEKKIAERKLLQFSRAVEQSPQSIIITDSSGYIEYVNCRFTEVTGYTLEDVLGKRPNILNSGFSELEVYKNIWKTIFAGNEWRGEFHNQRKNGESYWEYATISPVKNEYDEVINYLAIMEDITDRKIFEAELKNAKEKAEESDKLKSEFLAQMSHEIRTPVNTILSFISLVKEDILKYMNDDLRLSFEIIDCAGNRIIRTIDLLLNMAQVQTGTYEYRFSKHDIYNDVLNKIYTEFKQVTKLKGLEFVINKNTDNTLIEADEYSLYQVFNNLIHNAVKFTQKGKVEVNILRDKDKDLIVEISDTGIGIDKEFLQNLFKPFTQEEQGYTRRFEGNGLGLALVKKYCEINKAKIEVISKKNEGSIFRVRFLKHNN